MSDFIRVEPFGEAIEIPVQFFDPDRFTRRMRREQLVAHCGAVPRCPDHPTYRGIYKPRVKCEVCQAIFDADPDRVRG